MTEITKSITFLNEYKQLKKALEEGKTPVLAVGLAAIHKANLAAAVIKLFLSFFFADLHLHTRL